MKHYNIRIDEKEYKIRIRTRDHETLDNLLGGNFLQVVSDEKQMMDAMRIAHVMLYVGLRWDPENGQHTLDECGDLIDCLVDQGYSTEDFAKMVIEIGKVSGFFPQTLDVDNLAK